jgi:uncharacterized membrane protein
MKTHIAVAAAVASVMSLGLANAATAQSQEQEKCYGVSLAGQNDCGNLAGTHGCHGQSTVDNDIGEWRMVADGTCKELGGYSPEEAEEMFAKMQAKKNT